MGYKSIFSLTAILTLSFGASVSMAQGADSVPAGGGQYLSNTASVMGVNPNIGLSRPSIAVQDPGACRTPNGGLIANGNSIIAYERGQIRAARGERCQAERRRCDGGMLTGSYTYATCVATTASSLQEALREEAVNNNGGPSPSFSGGTILLSLYKNDLDFYTLSPISTMESGVTNFTATVDAADFFKNGGDHLVFAIDMQGGQGEGGANPHCGPIVRNSNNLWAHARGFIVLPNGEVRAEHWNGTSSPGVSPSLNGNLSGRQFQPMGQDRLFTLKITAGYRSGALANQMQVKIYAGMNTNAPLIFSSQVPWGWDYVRSTKAAVGGIAMGFQAPTPANYCVEQIAPRSAPNANIKVSNIQLTHGYNAY